MNSKPIIIVHGEPNSIFLEIFFKSLKYKKYKNPLVLICSYKILKFQMKKLRFKKHTNSNQIADDVMKNGILLGCHQGLKINDLNYITGTFAKFAKLKNLSI